MEIEEPKKPRGRVGMLIDGRWHIDERLGVGGMATVYAATHRNGNRVALKWLHTEMCEDADLRARFLREGYVVNKVKHPGVVRVLDDYTTEEGSVILVMDLLHGETLHAHYKRAGKLPLADAVRFVIDVLGVVAAAHEAGIVHRDLKPDNVFILKTGVVKVLDFGIARLRSASFVGNATRTGTTLGTPAFMPPEQACGETERVDERSDIWAIGAILFTLLAGEHVHVASTGHEELLAAASRVARSIAEVEPTVPEPVARVIDRALAYKREERWPSALAMQDALRQAMKTVLRPSTRTVCVVQPSRSASPPPLSAAPTTAPFVPIAARSQIESAERFLASNEQAVAPPTLASAQSSSPDLAVAARSAVSTISAVAAVSTVPSMPSRPVPDRRRGVVIAGLALALAGGLLVTAAVARRHIDHKETLKTPAIPGTPLLPTASAEPAAPAESATAPEAPLSGAKVPEEATPDIAPRTKPRPPTPPRAKPQPSGSWLDRRN